MNEILSTAGQADRRPDPCSRFAAAPSGWCHHHHSRRRNPVVNRRFSDAWVGHALHAVLAGQPGPDHDDRGLSLLHLVETLLWAVPITGDGIIPSLRDSYYFVLESYTTLGEGP